MNITKDQVLGYSIIDNKLKVFVKQGSISQSQNTENQSQESSAQQGSIPDIRNAEGEVKYYKAIGRNLSTVDEVESTNQRVVYEGWKQGNNYYFRIKPNASIRNILQLSDNYLKPYFDYKTNESTTSIKNIEPAVFNISSGQLTKKGKLELL